MAFLIRAAARRFPLPAVAPHASASRSKAFRRKARKAFATVAKEKRPQKTKSSFPGAGKEAQEVLKFAHPESHVPRFRVESWHLAAGIDDLRPVAVASQGSSLSHSA
jgi:hypothetical protein